MSEGEPHMQLNEVEYNGLILDAMQLGRIAVLTELLRHAMFTDGHTAGLVTAEYIKHQLAIEATGDAVYNSQIGID